LYIFIVIIRWRRNWCKRFKTN